MDRYKIFSCAANIFSTSCIQCTLTYLMTLNSYTPGSYYPLMLLPYSLILFAADQLFLHRLRTLMGLVLLNGGLGIGAFLSIALFGDLPDWGSLFFAALFCLWLAVQAGILTQTPPTLFSLILSVDLCLVTLALLTAYLSAFGLSVSWCGPIAAGCAASILGLIVYRSGSYLTTKSILFLAGIFAGVFAMVWLLVGYLAAPAGKGVVTLWNWLVSAARFLLDQLLRLLIFIFSLFPQAPMEETLWESPQLQTFQQEETLQANPVFLVILLAIIAVLALVLVIWLLLHLRRIRLSTLSRAARSTGARTGRISLLAGLRRLFSNFCRWVALRLTLWRNRNTAWGLYFILVRRSGLTPWHKLQGETPREFLCRLKEQAREDSALVQAFDTLIPAVEQAFYSPSGFQGTLSQAPLIRRRLSRTMTQTAAKQLLTSLFSRLRHGKTHSSHT